MPRTPSGYEYTVVGDDGDTQTHCVYCGIRVKRPGLLPKRTRHGFARNHPLRNPAVKTRDHIYPQSKGGWITVTCCTTCNNWKGSYPLVYLFVLPAFIERCAWARQQPDWQEPLPLCALIRKYNWAQTSKPT